jgi:hypothetical protein
MKALRPGQLEKTLEQLVGERFEVFFSVALVVHHEDGNVSISQVPDESVAVVVEVHLFHRFTADKVIVSIPAHLRLMPGDIPLPADIETHLHVDGETAIEDAPVENLYRIDIPRACELDEDQMIGPVNFQHVRIDFLQNVVKEAVVGRDVMPVLITPGIDPRFPVSLEGIVPLALCPDFRKVIDALERLSLAAREDSLFELAIERRFSTSRSSQEKHIPVLHSSTAPI